MSHRRQNIYRVTEVVNDLEGRHEIVGCRGADLCCVLAAERDTVGHAARLVPIGQDHAGNILNHLRRRPARSRRRLPSYGDRSLGVERRA